ncbi:MAG: hypothetical protein LBG80_03960 [Bacteroidales bacterium]|nr:hypothetical protein [Bacteroidales bacterium]
MKKNVKNITAHFNKMKKFEFSTKGQNLIIGGDGEDDTLCTRDGKQVKDDCPIRDTVRVPIPTALSFSSFAFMR